MRKLIQYIFRRPVVWLANKFSSSPNIVAVHRSLTRLLKQIDKGVVKKGLELEMNVDNAKLVIMSDHHKGNGNKADDFAMAKDNYEKALAYYNQHQFTYVAAGDVEELWENSIESVYECYKEQFEKEKAFVAANRFVKIFGNHDMYWVNTLMGNQKWLEKLYGIAVPVYEGLIIQLSGQKKPLRFFITHGHQGDKQSDGNRFSKWFVANIWSRVQAYLDVNVNTPSKDYMLRDKHNIIMYEWSAKHKHTVLITGHTHKPVFASMNHIERLQQKLKLAKQENDKEAIKSIQTEINKRMIEYQNMTAWQMKKPSYFNTGCCCFSDGDITAIEISGGKIKLVKWHDAITAPQVLEEMDLVALSEDL